MVHRGMLPRPRRHLDNRECRRRAQGALQGCQTVGGGGLQRQPSGAGGRPEGRRYRGGDGNGEFGRYVGSLPPTPALMVTGQEDVDHDLGGDGDAVLDGLQSGDRFSYLCKCLRTGPQAQLRPLHGYGLRTQCLPEVACQVTRGELSPPPPPID